MTKQTEALEALERLYKLVDFDWLDKQYQTDYETVRAALEECNECDIAKKLTSVTKRNEQLKQENQELKAEITRLKEKLEALRIIDIPAHKEVIKNYAKDISLLKEFNNNLNAEITRLTALLESGRLKTLYLDYILGCRSCNIKTASKFNPKCQKCSYLDEYIEIVIRGE